MRKRENERTVCRGKPTCQPNFPLLWRRARGRHFSLSTFILSFVIQVVPNYRSGTSSGATVPSRKVQPRPQLRCAGLCESVFASLRAVCAAQYSRAACFFCEVINCLTFFPRAASPRCFLRHFSLSDLNLGHLHLSRCLIDIIRDRIYKNLPRSLHVEASLDKQLYPNDALAIKRGCIMHIISRALVGRLFSAIAISHQFIYLVVEV